MSRPYLTKRDLFVFTNQSIKKPIQIKHKQKESHPAPLISTQEQQSINISGNWNSLNQLGLFNNKKQKSLLNFEYDESDMDESLVNSQKKHVKEKKKIINFTPKNTLQNQPIPPQNQKTREHEHQSESSKKAIENTKKDQQSQSEESKQQGPQKKNDKKAKKQKKIKKQENFVRLDLKRKYGDKFRGELYLNQRKYQRNGLLKYKYRKTVDQSELEINNIQFYNSYVHSLSKALYLTVNLDPKFDQNIQEKPKIQITGYSKPELELLINKIFGFEEFRFGQFQTISNILNQKSTLFVSETGSGKSLTYILTSILLGGLSIVISPLISLMLDQIANIPEILPAACISSLLTKQQKNRIIKMVKQGKINLLYITPQSLQTDLVYHMREFPPVNFVCVDQAHCVSQLSHNFRTTYLIINELINNHFHFKDKKNILCLTATANKQTIQSIIKKMSIDELIRSDSLRRRNLYVTISRQTHNRFQGLVTYLRSPKIKRLKGILIYCRTKKISSEINNYLSNSGFSISMYNAGLQQKQKNTILQQFRQGKIKIIVATIALGMGLDFENLDCVIHMNMPKSIESYVQEIGRAGRRGKKAYCHLFLDAYDYFTQRNFILAERLQRDSIKDFISKIKKYSKHKQIQSNFEIKRATQEIFIQEQFEKQEIEKKICYFKTKALCEELDLKSESIMTILLKIQMMSQKKLLTVLPPSYQIVKIAFFNSNHKTINQASQFFRKLTQGSKNFKGNLYVRLIDKCNQFNMTPIQIISQLHRLSDEYYLRLEFQNEIMIWRYIGEMNFQEFLQKHEKKLTQEMHQVEDNSIIKLNIMYSLSFLRSNASVGHILAKNPNLDEQNCTISSQIDNYFTTQPLDYYKKMCEQNNFLPTSQIEENEKREIEYFVYNFLKNEIDICKKSSSANLVVRKYITGKIIARIFMGVNTQAFNWKEYGTHPYWGKYKNKQYSDLLEVIRESIARFISDEDIQF